MPDTVAPAPASAPAPAPAAPASPAPAAAAPASPAPAPTIETATSIGEAWKLAQDSVPLGDDSDASTNVEQVSTDIPTSDPTQEATPADDAPPADPAATPDTTDPDLKLENLVLEDGDFGPKELGEFLKKDAGVEKFFNDHPEVRDRVYAMARRDSETRGIREIAPTLQIAQEMQRGHGLYTDIDSAFTGATTPDGFKTFMDRWVAQAMFVDDKGQPVMENGQYKLHPALTNILENIHNNRNSYLLGEMTQSGKIPAPIADSTLKVIDFLSKSTDERIQEAAQILKEAIAPSSSATGELPAELKPYSDSLKAKEKELNDRELEQNRQRSESETTARTQALFRADKKAADVCIGQVKPLLAKAGLTEYEQKAALSKIGDLIDGKLKNVVTYQTARDRLEQGSIDAAREKEIARLVLTHTQEILGPIVTQVIREATGGKLSRQTATQDRVSQQQQDSRTDPKGSSISSSTGAPMTSAQVEDTLVKEYSAAHNGEAPPRSWLTTEMWKRMNSAPGRRTA